MVSLCDTERRRWSAPVVSGVVSPESSVRKKPPHRAGEGTVDVKTPYGERVIWSVNGAIVASISQVWIWSSVAENEWPDSVSVEGPLLKPKLPNIDLGSVSGGGVASASVAENWNVSPVLKPRPFSSP